MNINLKLYSFMKDNNNIITTSQASNLGVSRALLSRYVKEGILERSRWGLYTLPEVVHDDMYTLMMRSKSIVFSHDTALFLNGLSDRTPFIHSITIPSNMSRPKSIRDECISFYIKPELHMLGVEERKTTFGNSVRCYNVERTICDLLRSRNRCDEETVISSVKNYAAFKDKDLNLLAEYARVFHVQKQLKGYLEVLL